jgi:cytochrome c oxidase subunit 2
VVLVAFMFYWGWTGYMDMVSPPADSYKIEVQAKQWSWTFVYPNGGSSNELHLPPNVPVEMVMTSSDVLHAFYVPWFRVKRDIVPGKTSTLWFTPTRPGGSSDLATSEYKVFCAEYCGTSHSQMWAPVVVHKTRAEFEKWVKDTVKDTPWKLYQLNCSSCHHITGPILIGPDFKGVYNSMRKVFIPETGKTIEVKGDEAYLRESILYPDAKISRMGKVFPSGVMSAQGFRDRLTPKQIDMLIEFLKDPERHEKEKK